MGKDECGIAMIQRNQYGKIHVLRGWSDVRIPYIIVKDSV